MAKSPAASAEKPVARSKGDVIERARDVGEVVLDLVEAGAAPGPRAAPSGLGHELARGGHLAVDAEARASARGALAAGWRATKASLAARLARGSRATAMSVTSLADGAGDAQHLPHGEPGEAAAVLLRG